MIGVIGASFSGNNETTVTVNNVVLHFRGKRILDAIADDLLTGKGMAGASDVVVSGCSAGECASLCCDSGTNTNT